MTRAWGTLLWLVGAALALGPTGGCQHVSGMADVDFSDRGAGGDGGGVPCDPAACPDAPGDCQTAICDAGQCSFRVADSGQVCAVGVGKVCNGVGECKQCLSNADCTSPSSCMDGFCMAPSCSNVQQDPGETDVDCGGPDCAPCPVDGSCVQDGDCLTLWCDAGVCAPCASHGDCPDEHYCDEAVSPIACAPQKQIGSPCEDKAECLSNDCDEVCRD